MRQSRKERQMTNTMKCLLQASREEAHKLMQAEQLIMESADEIAVKPVHPSIKHKR